MHIFNQQLDFRNDVLIVAKCIVNVPGFPIITIPSPVLIVAKCIVNSDVILYKLKFLFVLIVAKCIVNIHL